METDSERDRERHRETETATEIDRQTDLGPRYYFHNKKGSNTEPVC